MRLGSCNRWNRWRLDLSSNRFSGEIPPSLSNISYLSYLNLSHNNLSGRIPSGSQLDTLYLEHPDMYSGNNGLCGPPLRRNCSRSTVKGHGYGSHSRTAHIPEPVFFYLCCAKRKQIFRE